MPDFGSAADKALQVASSLPFTDFVDFTTGLVRNVTQALHESNREQLSEYVKLVDAVAGTLAEFETKTFGDLDTAARDYLNNAILPIYAGDQDSKVLEAAEVTNNEDVALVSDPDKRKTLTAIFDGITVPVNGVEEKFDVHVIADKIAPQALLNFAKAELRRTANQSYAELKALVQMGIMRIFPERVVLRTTLLYEAVSTDTASTTTSTVESEYENRSLNWGVNGSANFRRNAVSKLVRSAFGAAITGGVSSSRSSTKFKVATVDTKNTSNLETKIQITGLVEITMKTDYFPQLPAAAALPA